MSGAEHIVELTAGQASDFIAYVLPPLSDAPRDRGARNRLHTALGVVLGRGGRFTATEVAERVLALSGVELDPATVAAALQRAARTPL